MKGQRIRLVLLLIATEAAALNSSSHTDTPNVKCKVKAADHSGPLPNAKYYIATCSGLDLTRVPQDLPNTTVQLYLDRNRITQVGSFAFSYMPRLRLLDLSLSSVSTLSTKCFAGLNQLEELYLPFNNIFTSSQVAPGVFASLSQLRVLHVHGLGNGNYGTWSKEIEMLDSVEELGISYFNDMVFPSELASLPNLTNLQLSYGASNNITSKSLTTLRGGKIQELSFKASKDLAYIEPGSFDDMPELGLLNFACCYNLVLDHIIDVLSNASNTQVTRLIVDSTNRGARGDIVYGKSDILECRTVWRHLTHLSMQECGLQFIHAAALRCLQNLTAFTFGYAQVPIPYPFQEGMKILIHLMEHVLPKSAFQSMRFSYPLTYALVRYRRDWGCFAPYRRRPNTDYFPPIIESEPDSRIFSGDPYTTDKFQKGEATGKESEENETDTSECQDISFVPRNLQHFAVDNIGLAGRKKYLCLRFSNNNLRFLNLSDNAAFGPELNYVSYGLNQLRVADISRSRYRKLNPLLLQHLPSLTHLYASGNSLRQDSFTNIAKVRKLQHLDISDNAMPRLTRGIFLGLSKLRTIKLAKNQLNATDFLIDVIPFVQFIDVSGNQVRFLNETLRDAIDNRCASADCGLEINLLDNPLSCECEDLPFIKWIRTTRVNLSKAEVLKCTRQDGQIQTIATIDISSMDRYCNVMAHLPLIASISATVAIVVLVAAPLAYHFREYFQWYAYRLKYFRKRHPYNEHVEAGIRNAFVIYAFENDDDRRWVINTLRVKLEEEYNYSLWLEGRNDIPGRFKVDNLMDMLRRSHTAIWILSQAFLQDTICLEMAHQAFIRLGHKKNLVVRRPEVSDGIEAELAQRDIGHILKVLHPRFGIKVAGYSPEKINSETLFWDKIRNFLNKAKKFRRDHAAEEPEGNLHE